MIEVRLFLKAHFGQADAKAIVDGIEEIVDSRNDVLRNELASKNDLQVLELATRKDLQATRDELKGEIASVRLDMVNMKADLIEKIAAVKVGLAKQIWITALVQFLAVVGALLAIMQAMKK